jgi:hypothetical protein
MARSGRRSAVEPADQGHVRAFDVARLGVCPKGSTCTEGFAHISLGQDRVQILRRLFPSAA